MECHVIHHIEYVGGVHLAAAVHIGGCDLFQGQTAVIAYGNVGDVEHGVKDVGGVNAAAAVYVTPEQSADQSKSDVVFGCVFLGVRAGVTINSEVVAAGKGRFFNACHAVRYRDRGQLFTVGKSTLSYAGHAVWYLDFSQATTAGKGITSNTCQAVRHRDFGQTGTGRKSVRSKNRHTVRHRDRGQLHCGLRLRHVAG